MREQGGKTMFELTTMTPQRFLHMAGADDDAQENAESADAHDPPLVQRVLNQLVDRRADLLRLAMHHKSLAAAHRDPLPTLLRERLRQACGVDAPRQRACVEPAWAGQHVHARVAARPSPKPMQVDLRKAFILGTVLWTIALVVCICCWQFGHNLWFRTSAIHVPSDGRTVAFAARRNVVQWAPTVTLVDRTARWGAGRADRCDRRPPRIHGGLAPSR